MRQQLTAPLTRDDGSPHVFHDGLLFDLIGVDVAIRIDCDSLSGIQRKCLLHLDPEYVALQGLTNSLDNLDVLRTSASECDT